MTCVTLTVAMVLAQIEKFMRSGGGRGYIEVTSTHNFDLEVSLPPPPRTQASSTSVSPERSIYPKFTGLAHRILLLYKLLLRNTNAELKKKRTKKAKMQGTRDVKMFIP